MNKFELFGDGVGFVALYGGGEGWTWARPLQKVGARPCIHF